MQRMPILSDSDMSLFELKTRYVRNYFTYAGKNSKDFLLYISGPWNCRERQKGKNGNSCRCRFISEEASQVDMD